MKTPKRVKGWVPVPRNGAALPETRREAGLTPNRRVVRVVELRKGEVIVDVGALVGEFRVGWHGIRDLTNQDDVFSALRAALRKVGVR